MSIEPHHVSTLYNLAILFREEGTRHAVANALSQIRPSEAPPAMRKSAAQIMAEVGNAYAQEGQWQPGRRAFETACLFDPGDARIWFNRAAMLTNLGAIEDGCAKARTAARLDPAYPKPRELLSDFEGKRASPRALGQRLPYALRYVDSRGKEAIVLDFVVKIDASDFLGESEVARLSLGRDKDLYKLLVAKGHNARLAPPVEAKPKGLLGGLLGRKAAESTAEEARPFRFVLAQEPEPDFLRFAHAARWITPAGKEVASAPVDLFVLEGEHERLLPRTESAEPFRLPRTLPVDLERGPERFFPEGFAEYD